jgi:hypothetical protein
MVVDLVDPVVVRETEHLVEMVVVQILIMAHQFPHRINLEMQVVLVLEVVNPTSVVAVVVPVAAVKKEMTQNLLPLEEMVVLVNHSQHMPHQLLDLNSQQQVFLDQKSLHLTLPWVLLVSTVVAEAVVEETLEMTVEQQVVLVAAVPVDLVTVLVQQESLVSSTPEAVVAVADLMHLPQPTDLVVGVEPE